MPINFTANDVYQNQVIMAGEREVNSSQLNPGRFPRPITSTIDTFDQHTQIDYHVNAAAPGYRQGWNTPSIAVTNETVNTVRSSAPTKFVNPSTPSPLMYADVSTDITTFRPVPNMAQTLYVDSDVQVSFSVMIATAQVPDTVTLSIFRDRVQISQYYFVTTSSMNSATGHSFQVLGSGTFVDTNPTLRKIHVYDLRWHRGEFKAFAFGKHRTLQASNLRAQ